MGEKDEKPPIHISNYDVGGRRKLCLPYCHKATEFKHKTSYEKKDR